jgi:hypothetical protein
MQKRHKKSGAGILISKEKFKVLQANEYFFLKETDVNRAKQWKDRENQKEGQCWSSKQSKLSMALAR